MKGFRKRFSSQLPVVIKEQAAVNLMTGILAGVVIGAFLGLARGNVAIGILLGLITGIVIALALLGVAGAARALTITFTLFG